VCGLAGVVAAETARLERPLASALLGDLNHRGPDDRGWLTLRDGAPETGRAVKGDLSGEVVVVHTRLAIIDLTEGGHQPMASPDGRYWIAYNGEVYNYVELRAELERLGHVFRSSSDTEVLLAAYSEWGNAALSKLVGMFAFVIVDTVERRVILARDFFGMKPLYYSLAGLRLSFASEPRPLLRLPWVGRNADPRLVYDYLRFGLTDHTPGTLFRDIRQIPPAHVGVATLTVRRISFYSGTGGRGSTRPTSDSRRPQTVSAICSSRTSASTCAAMRDSERRSPAVSTPRQS